MDSIIHVATSKDGRPTVDARELHCALGVSRDFPTWFSYRTEQYGFVAGRDYQEVSPTSGENPQGGRPPREYALSVSMAKELAMVESSEAGRRVRQYLIRVEEAWHRPEAIMARALHVADDIIRELRPKAEAHDRFIGANGDICLQDAGRALGRQPNVFIRELLEDGILFRGAHSTPEPSHVYRERGYFRVRMTEVDGHAYLQTLVTPKGVDWLAARYPRTDRLGESRHLLRNAPSTIYFRSA